MRFTIAATLLAQSATVASNSWNTLRHHDETEEKEEGVPLHSFSSLGMSAEQDDGRRRLSSSRRRNTKVQPLLQRNKGLIAQKQQPSLGYPKTMFKAEDLDFVEECDPTDAGILSCEELHYCIESEVSSMGGVCVPQDNHSKEHNNPRRRGWIQERHKEHQQEQERVLQIEGNFTDSFCDYLYSSLAQEDCTCIEDSTTGFFEVSCLYEDVCGPPVPGPCNETETIVFCGSGLYTYFYTATQQGYKVCYYFDTPIDMNYCVETQYFNFDFPPGNDGSNIAVGCDVEIDGTRCNDCQVNPNALDGSLFYGSTSYPYSIVLDCENTVLESLVYIGHEDCNKYGLSLLLVSENETEFNCYDSLAFAIGRDYFAC